MRASRLLSILLLLQARGRLTAEQLAGEFGVSVRTIYRDVEALSTAGVPVYGEAGPAGGYRLLDGYRTRLTGLTTDEAQALFLTGMPGPAAELGLGSLVATAQLKLQAALPPDLRDRAVRLQDRFHLDTPGWYSDGDTSPHLATVSGAVWEGRRIEVLYRRWKEPTDVTRTLDPYGIVCKSGRWYLVAAGGVPHGPRTYRINQIRRLRVLDEPFDRPPDFDLSGYWQAHLVQFRAALQLGEAVVRLSPRALERLPDLVSSTVQDSIAVTASVPDANGWLTATVPIESLIHAETEFLKFGADIEVLQPPSLRARLAATARRLSEIYRP